MIYLKKQQLEQIEIMERKYLLYDNTGNNQKSS